MKGYKTFLVNTAAAVLPLIDMALNNGSAISGVLGTSGEVALSLLGLVNIVLRWVTDTPIFKSE